MDSSKTRFNTRSYVTEPGAPCSTSSCLEEACPTPSFWLYTYWWAILRCTEALVTAYEIYYFPIRGRAQAIRYLMIDAGVDYKDVPVTPDKWVKELKPKMPFGQLPLVKEGELEIAQSGAIMRYLGRKHGRHPKDDEKALKVDMINDHIEDLRKDYSDLIYKNYENGKEDFIKGLPQKLQYIDNLLAKWKETYILEEITFVDYNCFDMLDILLILSPGCLDSFPSLKKYYDTIASLPKIKAYRESEAFTKLQVNGNKNQ